MTILIPSSAWAFEAFQPDSAPLDADFIEYQTDLDSNQIMTHSINDYNTGYMPPPLTQHDEGERLTLQASTNLPSYYDLRSTGRLSPIRHQGSSQNCWAFSALASLESYLKETVDFSENNMILNHGFDYRVNDGGNRDIALAYLSRWDGPIYESDDPYGSSKKTSLSPQYHVQSTEFLPKSETAIKEALMNGGALETTIYSKAIDDPTYYNETNAALYYTGSAPIDHSVTIVGWDDNYSRHNFNTLPTNNGAWIIRNSWGSDWGENGYFYLSYSDSYAGHKVTAFHSAEAVNNYQRIYQYDPLGNTSARGYKSSSAWGANIFTASTNENLTAISTYAASPNTSLEIEIYTNPDANAPNSGQLQSSQSESFAHAGYYTIDLDLPISLKANEKFAVVIEYHTPTSIFPVPVESPVANYSSRASANAGESFVDDDGSGGWYDLGDKQNSNICIKAYTADTVIENHETQSKQPSADCYYRTHIQDIGWQDLKKNGDFSGSSGKSLRLEGIEINVDSPNYDLGLQYSTHVENIGWQNWQTDGSLSGTSGQGLRLEAIMVELTGEDAKHFDVYYRTHVQNVGWLNWASNGSPSGTAGYGYRLEGIEIIILPKGVAITDSTAKTSSNKNSYLKCH